MKTHITKTYTVDVYDNGSKEWCLNGKLHREDGPAVEHTGGTKCWYLNGQRHREDKLQARPLTPPNANKPATLRRFETTASVLRL